MGLVLCVDGREAEVPDDGASLLEVLRDRLGVRSPKDGCSPQGQCGCCTVLIDGQPRVACVTPARRVAGRRVTTLDGLPDDVRRRWADAFVDAGASQCGFCTPGIIVRLAALAEKVGKPLTADEVEGALVAHLCRCTGWRTIVEAALAATQTPSDRASSGLLDSAGPAGPAASAGSEQAASVGRAPVPAGAAQRPPPSGTARESAVRRAELEGGVPQGVGRTVVLGGGGFADDSAPADALVAVPDGAGGWAVAETLSEARAAARKVQGRRTTLVLSHPLDVPPGDWRVTLRTTWVEPAYLELDASWCVPGGTPASPLANGGAFGGKTTSPVPAAARRLADLHGRPVRVLWAREDAVRLGPKRPPVAAGIAADGSGTMRIVRTDGIGGTVAFVAPGLRVEHHDVAGPPTSAAIRAAGWAEAAALVAALRWRTDGSTPAVVAPGGALASATVQPGGAIVARVACGPALDPVVLRSYVIGAAHQALSWVTSEGLSVDGEGAVQDLTVRSFGILRARQMPPVDARFDAGAVEVVADATGVSPPVEPVNGSDAVFAAVAAAVWIDQGLAQDWPTNRGGS